jgi:hypothetical protein
MNKQKELELIKQVIDQAIKGGLFQNVETAIAVGEAFMDIVKELQKDESQPQ